MVARHCVQERLIVMGYNASTLTTQTPTRKKREFDQVSCKLLPPCLFVSSQRRKTNLSVHWMQLYPVIGDTGSCTKRSCDT